MRKIASNDELMTTREAGETLGVAVRTVQLWVEAGILPAWRTAGGHRRIARSAVEKLMAERAELLATPPAEPKPQTTRKGPMKVLVVEDDPAQLRLMSKVVQGWKFPVTLATARDGFEGLVRMGQISPDWLITDLNMPSMNGFEMLRSLTKQGVGLGHTQVAVVSAMTAQEVKQHGGLPKGVHFLPKPVHFGQLEALVRG
jgi:excisionase family DNA binding protein